MSPAAPADYQRVLFDASTSEPVAAIAEYRWDFGDGERDSGETVDHDYNSLGLTS